MMSRRGWTWPRRTLFRRGHEPAGEDGWIARVVGMCSDDFVLFLVTHPFRGAIGQEALGGASFGEIEEPRRQHARLHRKWEFEPFTIIAFVGIARPMSEDAHGGSALAALERWLQGLSAVCIPNAMRAFHRDGEQHGLIWCECSVGDEIIMKQGCTDEVPRRSIFDLQAIGRITAIGAIACDECEWSPAGSG